MAPAIFYRHQTNVVCAGVRTCDCSIHEMDKTDNIHTALNTYSTFESRGVFLDISKAFDKVWHKVLIFKPQSIVFDVIRFYWKLLRKQVSNVEKAEWLPVNAGAPQGFYSRLRKLIFQGK